MKLSADVHIEQIRAACHDKIAGALIVPIQRTIANLSILQGTIYYIFYRGRTGMPALTLLRDDLHVLQEPLRLKFLSGSGLRDYDDSLPQGDAFFDFLAADTYTPEPDTTIDSVSVITGVVFDEVIQIILVRILLPYVGKKATEICEMLATQTDSLRVAIDLLSEHIGSVEAITQIKHDLRRELTPLIDAGQISIDTVLSVPTEVMQKTSGIEVQINDQERRCITDAFTEVAGPMAPIVLSSPEIEDASSLRSLIDFLYLQLPDKTSADQFRTQARAELDKL